MMSQTGPNKPPLNSGGFTFLEIIIVVLILAALIGMSAPRFKNTFADLQLRQACSDFANILNYSRQGAILNRTEYRIRLKADDSSYWIERNIEKDGVFVFEKPSGRFGKITALPKSVNISSEEDTITFYPDGSADIATVVFSNSIRKTAISTEGSASDVKIK